MTQMKAKVLVSLYGGLFETGPRVFIDDKKADEAWKLQKGAYGIVDGHEDESDNEVRLFEDVEIEGDNLCTQRQIRIADHEHEYFVTHIPTLVSGAWFTIHDAFEVWAAVAMRPDGEVVGWRNVPADPIIREKLEKAIKTAFPEYFDTFPPLCPKCGKQITYLDARVTLRRVGTFDGSLDVVNEDADPEYSCPECGATLFETEEAALAFLGKSK
jgi:predicted RNA-binding Zn-ribbon protein involved in translation (DUF1610 family)